ncbi:MAG: hypothetical protein JSV03_15945, partial [Planctomycetota bacterium]
PLNRYNAVMISQASRYSCQLVAAAVLCSYGAMSIGCGPRGDIHLTQPYLPEWQRDVHLQSEQVYWAAGKYVERILAEFPLPGATTGKPNYLFYLRFPVGEKKPMVAARKWPTMCGFIIQIRGEYAGLASITGGKAVIRGTSQATNATRQLNIELNCEDGSKIVGRLRAKRDDWYVTKFENRRRPADVQALINKSPKPVDTKSE